MSARPPNAVPTTAASITAAETRITTPVCVVSHTDLNTDLQQLTMITAADPRRVLIPAPDTLVLRPGQPTGWWARRNKATRRRLNYASSTRIDTIFGLGEPAVLTEIHDWIEGLGLLQHSQHDGHRRHDHQRSHQHQPVVLTRELLTQLREHLYRRGHHEAAALLSHPIAALGHPRTTWVWYCPGA